VIFGSHVIVFSRDPEADRAFFANVLGQPHVDAGAGWLIFKLPAAELAVHPSDGPTGHGCTSCATTWKPR
jgi:catechol 2,3-dioxygenase-like lactoylglutathione lyase family enzyme